MKFIITTYGSAGDIHPFMAIAHQLEAAGHECVIITSAKFQSVIEHAGLRCLSIGTVEEFDRQLADPRLWSSDKALGMIFEAIAAGMTPTLEAIKKELTADAVLIGSSLAFPARIARDLLGIPMASIHLAPSLFWSEKEPPLFEPRVRFLQKLPPLLARMIYRLMDFVIDKKFAGKLNDEFERIGYRRVSRLMGRWVHSPDLTVAMFPDWFGPAECSITTPIFQAGFPLYTEDHVARIPAPLLAFLDDGAPPVAFAPGSANIQAADFFHQSLKACEALGIRGVFITPAEESIPRHLPPSIHHVRYVPFARLFPHCAAVVHHGGIGTTAQCFAAGVPQLVTPMAHDQFDNANRVARLGVGRVLPAKKYRNPAIQRELSAVLEGDQHRQAAQAIKERMRLGADWQGLVGRLEALGRRVPTSN